MELILKKPEEFSISKEIRTRFVDLDLMGHLNNAVYFTLFEEGRFAYFERIRGMDFSPTSNFSFILAEIACQFLSPVQMGEILTVWTSVTSVGRKSFTIEYLVTRHDQTPVAKGKSVQVMYDYSAGKTISIPDEIFKQFEKLEKRPLTRM
ncbi:MAG: acyl-CoA thioesterase [Deltaproteobacteria bacterium]|nr:acyl-CoA thioesterase [Deltaproteobacteria bacterium]